MDPRKKVFEELDLPTLRLWINERRQEDLHLDFKTLRGGNEFDKEDRKTFAKAVSGFANSDGGLLIWGIVANKDADGVDAAREEVPIHRLQVALSKLQSITGEAVSPIIPGIGHRPIPVEGDTGFIVTYVPASDSGPHMARSGDGRYYKRSGDSFYQMEHFDIADMFGRRQRPVLRLIYGITGVRRNAAKAELDVALMLENFGRGVARFPFLGIVPPPMGQFGGMAPPGFRWLSYAGPGSKYTTVAGDDTIAIHPGTNQFVLAGTLFLVGSHYSPSSIQIEYQVAAIDHPLTHSVIEISEEEIRQRLPTFP